MWNSAISALALSIISIVNAVDLSFFSDPKDVVAKEPLFETNVNSCQFVNVNALSEQGTLKAQDLEDQCLFTFFNGLCGGKFLDVGALDGVNYSNTYAFYASALEWRGVNVELVPENFEKLKKRRRHDLANVQAAVCAEPKKMHYVRGRTSAVGGLWEYASPGFRDKFFGEEVELKDTTAIQCTPLQLIIDKVFGEKERVFFDVLSLDIEQAELPSLRGINFKRTGFGIMIIERYLDKDRDERVRSFLDKKGYDELDRTECGGADLRNHWFINRDFDRIYAKARFSDERAKDETEERDDGERPKDETKEKDDSEHAKDETTERDDSVDNS